MLDGRAVCRLSRTGGAYGWHVWESRCVSVVVVVHCTECDMFSGVGGRDSFFCYPVCADALRSRGGGEGRAGPCARSECCSFLGPLSLGECQCRSALHARVTDDWL